MKKDIRIYLDDVIESCTLIAKYIEGKNKQDFDKNEELQDAVIRRLEIIGEAIKRIPKDFRDKHPEIVWKKATGMRDVLIHAYDEVETNQVWLTITEALPSFKQQIEQLLKIMELED